MSMQLSCVILNYNDAETTEKLVKQLADYDVLHQIIVVDNASTDDSLELLGKLELDANASQRGNVRVISADHNGGYGSGNNLGVRYAASIARVTRTSMLEVLSQDFMRTAEAKGVKKWVIILKHGLRNALIPIITIAGTQLGDIFTGSILIESIFAMPGMGKLLLDAINARDLPLIQGGVMYIALICVVVYLVVDILYAVVDPRIRLGEEAAE